MSPTIGLNPSVPSEMQEVCRSFSRWLFTGTLDPMAFSESFFEVSAQLIPVLFLTLALEERLRPADEETPTDRVARTWAATLLLTAEILSMSVVAGGMSPSKGVGSVVSSTMLFGALVIALRILEPEFDGDRARWENIAHLLAGIFILGVFLWTIIAVQFS